MQATHDPYASRSVGRWEIIERPDPVIWGQGSGPLSAEQVATFDRDGFLVIPRLFNEAEIRALVEEAVALRDSADPSRDDVIVEPGSQAVRSLFRVHKDGAAFARLAAHERLAGAARQILASDVYIHQSRINFKPGFVGKWFPWHSDFETWHMEDGMPRPRALSASLLLTDNYAENGPLMLVPGSHKYFVRCVGEAPKDHFKLSLVNQMYGVPDPQPLTELIDKGGIESATGPAGTVLFFDCNTMHGSAGNITPMPRNNVFLVYNSMDNTLRDPYGTNAPRPAFLADRHPAAI